MSETYTDGAGIGKHMELAGKDMPEMMPKLIEYMGECLAPVNKRACTYASTLRTQT